MVASMRKIRPEGLGHDLLLEWGRWVRDDSEGRASWAVKPRVDPGFRGEFPREVQIVDRIVAKHRLKNHTDWSVISRLYLSDLAVWQIAKGLRWPENRVALVAIAMCGLVEREYLDWKRGMEGYSDIE